MNYIKVCFFIIIISEEENHLHTLFQIMLVMLTTIWRP